MERAAWTDERLDDLSKRMVDGFARVDADLRELRTDLREQFGELRADLRSEIGGVRADLSNEIGGVRRDLSNEIGGVRRDLSTEIGGVRGDLSNEIGGVPDEIAALRLTMLRVGGGMMVTMLGVLVAVLARGA
jgi:hypothetical protein